MSVVEHNKQELNRKFVSGLAWTTGAKWLTQGVSWLSVVLGARLLSPSDFGTMEMAGFVAMVAGLLAEFGLGSAVLQMQEMEEHVIAQLNTVSLLFGAAAVGLSALMAPLYANFFHAPALVPLILWNSLSFIPMAFQAVPQGLLQKQMDYRRLSLIEAVQAIMQAALLIACAYQGLAYWSFVISVCGGRVVAAALAMFWSPVPFHWPRWSQVSKAVTFGTEISLSRVGGTISSQSDGLVIGRMLGESQLGLYRFAISLAHAPADKVAMLIMRVTGPLFAKVQNDTALMRHYFLMLSDALGLVLFPLMVGFIVVAPDGVAVLLGPQWQAAVLPAQWLAAFVGVRSLVSLMSQALTSLRQTRLLMWMSLVGFLIMPVAFYVASFWGMWAVAAAWLVMSPLTMVPMALRLFNLIECSPWDYLRILRPSALATVVMAAAVYVLSHWVLPPQWLPLWRLTPQVVVGGLVYVGMIWVLHRGRIRQYIVFLQRLRKNADPLEPTEGV